MENTENKPEITPVQLATVTDEKANTPLEDKIVEEANFTPSANAGPADGIDTYDPDQPAPNVNVEEAMLNLHQMAKATGTELPKDMRRHMRKTIEAAERNSFDPSALMGRLRNPNKIF